mmetsp:Transcript_3891/g.9275  ORF Transcript_3891/g.9275 Transcript_3891/m.9275 type:complete len:252 (-) Transcript_3891:1800-2555(-)
MQSTFTTTSLKRISDGRQNVVERLGGIHGISNLDGIDEVISTEIYRISLGYLELFHDLRTSLGEGIEHWLVGIVFLSKKIGPVESNIEIGSTVIDLVHLTRRRLSVVEDAADGLVEAFSEKDCLWIVGSCAELLKGNGECQVFSQTVPSQVTLLDKLLDVLWSRTTGASFVQSTTGEKWNNRQHFCGSSELQNWEKVRQVITEDVTGDTDGILSGRSAFHRNTNGVNGFHYGDIEAAEVVVIEVCVNLLDQ